MLTNTQLRAHMQGADAVSDQVLSHIYAHRWLQLWVPKDYGGLGVSFEQGLQQLYQWSTIDGSLGWMATLCAGANYFSRNLSPQVAKELFQDPKTCFGGSGMVGGSARLTPSGDYIINGLWHYATGAPYLSHFTLTATVVDSENVVLLDEHKQPILRSFILEKSQVKVIKNWKSMGMRASGTFSFEVKDQMAKKQHSFVYDDFYVQDPVSRIPFRVFADLTLLVNYAGVATHYVELAQQRLSHLCLQSYGQRIDQGVKQIYSIAQKVEDMLGRDQSISPEKQQEWHQFGLEFVEDLSTTVVELHRQLGIVATQMDQPIYQVFCDFFTALMHANFRPKI